MKIDFLDIGRENKHLLATTSIANDIINTFEKGTALFGENSDKCEKLLSTMTNSIAVLVGSGTDALMLALKAIGIEQGCKVAIPAISAIPTAAAVKFIGAIPVYVDVGYDGTMNCIELEKVINNVDAVIPVHLYGNPVSIDIFKLCKLKNVPVIEDWAQGMGITYDGKIQIHGIAAALSFYPSKNIGVFGDGGCVLTNDEMFSNSIRELRFYGQKTRNHMGNKVGMNSRMDEIQTSILLHKLNLFNEQSKIRLEMLYRYDIALKNNEVLSPVSGNIGRMPHLYTALVNAKYKRHEIMDKLMNYGIQTLIHYPFHLKEVMEHKYGVGIGTVAKDISNRTISIPFNPWITKEEEDYIFEIVGNL